MELRQLRYFVVVAEEANFTRAAERLHVAQPGVSAQIRQLERELGEELLDRSGRVVRLTEAGKAAIPYARAALAAVEGVRNAVDEVTGLVRGRISVGTVASISSTGLDLPGLMSRFHREHPAVGISLKEDNSSRMVQSILEGRMDVAFLGVAETVPEGIEAKVVYEDALVVAVSRDDALSSRQSIALEEVAERDIISLPRGTGLRSLVDEAYAGAGFRPRTTFEVGDPRLLVSLVENGLGVAVLPHSMVSGPHTEGIAAITLKQPPVHGRIALSWRSGGTVSPAARAFIRLAGDFLSST